MIIRQAKGIDVEVAAAPKFWVLALLAAAIVLLQATVLQTVSLRGAHPSLLTVLLAWTGLRCGIIAGGWLGFVGGIMEDALGGAGVNVVGATLVGYLAGLVGNRYFWDSLPVFVATVAGATVVRAFSSYAFVAFVLGDRGMLTRMSHATFWEMLANAAAAALTLALLRYVSKRRLAAR